MDGYTLDEDRKQDKRDMTDSRSVIPNGLNDHNQAFPRRAVTYRDDMSGLNQFEIVKEARKAAVEHAFPRYKYADRDEFFACVVIMNILRTIIGGFQYYVVFGRKFMNNELTNARGQLKPLQDKAPVAQAYWESFRNARKHSSDAMMGEC